MMLAYVLPHMTQVVNVENDEYDENGDVGVRMPGGERRRVPRFMISVPVECCVLCATPLSLQETSDTSGIARCPNYAKHMHKQCAEAANDTANLNRATRHRAYKESVRWLRIWKAQVERRREKRDRLTRGIRPSVVSNAGSSTT